MSSIARRRAATPAHELRQLHFLLKINPSTNSLVLKNAAAGSRLVGNQLSSWRRIRNLKKSLKKMFGFEFLVRILLKAQIKMTDGQLLKTFVEQNSQAAFTTLMKNHINMVYSVCLREVRDADLAQDVTQVVFLILAKKAASLCNHKELSGWLYKTARFACNDALKQERRRQQNELKAGEELMHQAQIETAEVSWDEIEPALHGALDALNREDRALVLQRFFAKKSLKEVGAIQGISEDAARMRVSRALEKMRQHFKRQGFVVSALTLAALFTAHAAQAAPASCVTTVLQLGNQLSPGLGHLPVIAVEKPAVLSLFDSAMRAAFLSQVKVAVVAMLGVVALGSGVLYNLHKMQARPSFTQTVPTAAPATQIKLPEKPVSLTRPAPKPTPSSSAVISTTPLPAKPAKKVKATLQTNTFKAEEKRKKPAMHAKNNVQQLAVDTTFAAPTENAIAAPMLAPTTQQTTAMPLVENSHSAPPTQETNVATQSDDKASGGNVAITGGDSGSNQTIPNRFRGRGYGHGRGLKERIAPRPRARGFRGHGITAESSQPGSSQ